MLPVLLFVALAIETVNVLRAERFISDISRTVLGVAIWFVVFKRPRERVAAAVGLVAASALSWGRYLAAGALVFSAGERLTVDSNPSISQEADID